MASRNLNSSLLKRINQLIGIMTRTGIIERMRKMYLYKNYSPEVRQFIFKKHAISFGQLIWILLFYILSMLILGFILLYCEIVWYGKGHGDMLFENFRVRRESKMKWLI